MPVYSPWGQYSIFLWDDDKRGELISHPTECPIPLMSVNERDGDNFSAYLSSTESRLTKEGDVRKVDQQTTGQTLTLPIGMIIRFNHNNKMKLYEVIGKDDLTEQK